ncbi:MAG: CpaF family protein, partial [Henriciella sp.]
MSRFSLLSKSQSQSKPAEDEKSLDETLHDLDAETSSAPTPSFEADDAESPAAEAEDDHIPPSFDLLDAKLRVHNKLIDELDLSMLDKLDENEMKKQVRRLVTEIVRDERIPMNQAEVANFADSVYHEMTGLGPLEPLLEDPTISDILINGYNQVYVERRGELE